MGGDGGPSHVIHVAEQGEKPYRLKRLPPTLKMLIKERPRLNLKKFFF
jgi:hypothetical protein